MRGTVPGRAHLMPSSIVYGQPASRLPRRLHDHAVRQGPRQVRRCARRDVPPRLPDPRPDPVPLGADASRLPPRPDARAGAAARAAPAVRCRRGARVSDRPMGSLVEVANEVRARETCTRETGAGRAARLSRREARDSSRVVSDERPDAHNLTSSRRSSAVTARLGARRPPEAAGDAEQLAREPPPAVIDRHYPRRPSPKHHPRVEQQDDGIADTRCSQREGARPTDRPTDRTPTPVISTPRERTRRGNRGPDD